VTGRIPHELAAPYYRTGEPGLRTARALSLVDGDGMITPSRSGDGRAHYRTANVLVRRSQGGAARAAESLRLLA